MIGIIDRWLKRRAERKAEGELKQAAAFEELLNAEFERFEARLKRRRELTGECLLPTGICTSVGEKLCRLKGGHEGPHSPEPEPNNAK